MSLNTIDFRRFPVRPGLRLLDLGSGEGRHVIAARDIAEELETVGIDQSLDDLKVSRERFKELHEQAAPPRSFWLSVADGARLPFADGSFDRIICSEVLEHVRDVEQVLGEMKRVLKPDGLLAVSVPSWFPEWVCWRLSADYHNQPGGHVRIFRGPELRRRIERLDLTLYARHRAHALHVPYWWLKCWFRGGSEEPWAVRKWHELLVWDLMRAPFITRFIERLLNPLLGKSLVMYFACGDRRRTGPASGAAP